MRTFWTAFKKKTFVTFCDKFFLSQNKNKLNLNGVKRAQICYPPIQNLLMSGIM